MNKIKFYFDTHIAKQVAIQLRNNGVDIVRCEEVGLAKASDIEHLEYAIKEGRVMVSVDRHFPGLHDRYLAEGKHHTGIIRIKPYIQKKIGRIVKDLRDYHELIEAEAGSIEVDIHDNLIYIG